MSGDLLYKGYHGTLEWSEEDKCFYGKIRNTINGDHVGYEADTLGEIGKSFRDAVDDYIETRRKLQ